jgi:nitroreductase
VLEAGRLSPSASNRQEWKFLVVRDKQTIEKLVGAANGQKFVGEAPVVIVMCATESERVMRCGKNAYTVDLSISTSYMMLEAWELGLGACWLGSFYEDQVKDILNIPDNIRVVTMFPLGYPEAIPEAKPRKSIDQVTCCESYK